MFVYWHNEKEQLATTNNGCHISMGNNTEPVHSTEYRPNIFICVTVVLLYNNSSHEAA
jgi:hypothetical protein